jgi:hypothetical protein
MKLTPAIWLSLATSVAASPFVRRGLEKCKNLQAENNNGGRKIAIVIDESGSMASADPYDLRIDAGKAVNDWLISSSEAGNGKDADQVTVIGFDDEPRILYPLGDPSGADRALDNITILGGTYIAGGVDEGIYQLANSSDKISNSSGIVVLTDGSDFSTELLVDSINNAGQQGIRVSFGFLDGSGYGFSYQDPEVLRAILGTGGMYSTINGDMAQNAFVNVMIVHGLTDNDNPSAKDNKAVYNGLSVAFMLGSDGTSSLTYQAEGGETLTFSISSISAGDLNVTAVDASGKEIGKATVDSFSSYTPEELEVKVSSGGSLELKIQGDLDDLSFTEDPMFIVGVNSSIPLTNCTLGGTTKEKSGLSKGAKAGIGVAVPLLIGVFAAGSYFAWKYFKGLPPKTAPPPASYPSQPTPDYKQPYIQTDSLPTPSPQPTNTHPGWSMPPPKFQAPNQPPGDTPQKPDHHNYNLPNQPTDPSQKPMGPGDHSHPPQLDPSHPTQADPSHPTQADPSHPTQADPSHPTQADPSHPTQADPSHPTQADPSHPTQADPSHPTQADPYHPTQADPSHPTQADPNYPTQADPNHPTQADPYQPNNPTTDSNPNQPCDPNQPPQNPNDPQDPKPKRLPTPRWFPRILGRRRKKDEEEQNQQQNQYQQHPPNQTTFDNWSQGRPQPPPPQPQVYPGNPHSVNGSPWVQQQYQQLMYGQPQATSPQPQYSVPNAGPQWQQQAYPQGQYGPPPSTFQPHQSPIGTAVSSPQPQYVTPYQSGAQQQPYEVAGAPPVAPSPPQNYAAPASVSQQQGLIQQFPQPPPSAGNDRAAYNVSPVLDHAQPVQPAARSNVHEIDVIAPVNTGMGSITRKPVGGS